MEAKKALQAQLRGARKGARRRAESLTPAQRRKIAKAAAAARWGNHPTDKDLSAGTPKKKKKS